MREEREVEQRRIKTEALFRGLAAANQANEEKQSVGPATNFENIMSEEAHMSLKQIEKEQRIKKVREG